MLTLKKYQAGALAALGRFFEEARVLGPEGAYGKVTAEPEVAARLGALRRYRAVEGMPGVPCVGIKIPTGGGKTIVAAHALRVVAGAWMGRDFPFVIWFVPSEAIRAQTAEALKNPSHPYRRELDAEYGGRVRVCDLDEREQLRPEDVVGNLCVVVATVQAFVKEDTGKYNVYRDAECWEPHFREMGTEEGMELGADGRPKLSFANLLHHWRPLMVVDEAHNVVSALSLEMMRRLNPAAVVGFSATPDLRNNTLYSVTAREVFDEEMIKLPIRVVEFGEGEWEGAVAKAVVKREELEKIAQGEEDYLRPIVLFQAMRKGGAVGPEELRRYLVERLGISGEQVAIATGEQRELAGVDVLAKDCPLRFIITIEALREGWDCPFASVLCSLANVGSDKATTQLLGRVMRMPYAKRRKAKELNEAWAFVLSREFDAAAEALTEKLRTECGFEESEAASAVYQQTFGECWGLEGLLPEDTVRIPKEVTLMPEMTEGMGVRRQEDGSSIVFFTEAVSAVAVAKLAEAVRKQNPINAAKLEIDYKTYLARHAVSPAGQGAKFSVPAVKVRLENGELRLWDAEEIAEEAGPDDILAFAGKELTEAEFQIEPQSKGFKIFLDGNQIKRALDAENGLFWGVELMGQWTSSMLVRELDRIVPTPDIPQPRKRGWLQVIVEGLLKKPGYTIERLVPLKHLLARKLTERIEKARQAAHGQVYQQVFSGMGGGGLKAEVTFNESFEMKDGIYQNPRVAMYRGPYVFAKAFLGASSVPAFDGKRNRYGEGEEYDCAVALDRLAEVRYWIRNVAGHPDSFWLPSFPNRFYPDFVAELNDGRVFVVEYKGEALASNEDTARKRAAGEFWMEKAGGRTVFAIIERNKGGMDMAGQMRAALARRLYMAKGV